MSTTYGENAVQNFLKSFGFNVTKIPELPEQNKETPDFLVKDESTHYIIEIKDKEDQKFRGLVNSRVPGKKTVGLEYNNTIAGIIKDGASQLDAYEKTGNKFKVIWFFIDTSVFSAHISRQIGWTLYGLRELEGYTKNGKYFGPKGCFYFTYSDFYKYKLLDAVVVHGPNEIVLCMNDFSHHSNKLRQTKFYRLFEKEKLHIIEPLKLEKESRCFIVDDFSIDRKNSETVADYIGRKYNLRQITAYDFSLFNFPLD